MIFPKAYEGSESYVFVSYDAVDEKTVIPIVEALSERGFRIWYNEGCEEHGDWPEHTAQRLDDCAAFVAFLSQASHDSQSCRREINYAISQKKEPLVIYLEDLKMSLGMRMQLSTTQAIYYNRYASESDFLSALSDNESFVCCRGNAPHKASSEPCQGSDMRASEQAFREAKLRYERGAHDEALPRFREAAELGHAEAQFYMGECYESGFGVRADNAEAMRWYVKSAESGCAAAQYRVGYSYYFGNDLDENQEEAAKWWGLSAEQDNTDAQCWLARCHIMGHGVPEDVSAAVHWYTRAAELGCAEAQYNLGRMYFFGSSIDEDEEKGVQLFLKAAENGHIEAQYMIGNCYSEGSGVPKNMNKAVEWWKKATEQGSYMAQDKLRAFGYSR